MTAPAAAGVKAPDQQLPLILGFAEVRPEHLPLVGAKGFSLASLAQAGFPVPDGFCLTTEAMRAFTEESEGLAARLAEIARQAISGGLSLQESWAFLGETRKYICEAPIPPRVEAAIRGAYVGGLGEAVVAVRSSGAKEDLEGASFAGQYETFLNVRGLTSLANALRRCWASVWRNRVLQYAARKAGGVATDLTMCVVVQRLVRAAVSGVLFTVNPLTGRDGEMLVESCFGLGEALVSGKVNADRHVIDARTGAVLFREIACKKVKVVPHEAAPPADASPEPPTERPSASGVREIAIGTEEGRRPALTDADVAALCRLGGDVQAFHERPMDIEWAIEDGKLHLLQARPITKLSFPPDFGEWTNANFKDGGVASDVCTPFMASCYDEIFTETMNHHWRELRLLPADREVDWLLVNFAKPYWNVGEVKRCMTNVPGFVERDLDRDLGMAIRYEGPGIVVPFSIGLVVRALPTLFAVRRLYRERLAFAKAHVRNFLKEYEAWDAIDPAALADAALAERYQRLLDDLYKPTESAYFLTVYNLSMSKVDFKVIFDKANRRAGGTLDYLKLVLGLRDVAHLRPFHELWKMALEARETGRRPDLAAFVKRWQHHSTRELDITVPRWGEDPSFVEQIYEQYVREGGAGGGPEAGRDPVRQAENQRSVYEAERAKARRLLRLRPLTRLRLFRGLRRIREYTWWREEMRDCSTRAYFLVRKWSLEVGRRAVERGILDRADDIFMIEKSRAKALARNVLDPVLVRAEVRWARQYLKSFRKFQNPNEIGSRHTFAEARARKPWEGEAREGAARLSGVAGSPGRVRGRCRIVRRLEEAKKVGKGDVLVTVFTDPGWTPLLSLVSAIVTETGGLLSHAAVISREYGIPAVLAAMGATEVLREGQEVIVDGTAGTVEAAV